MQIKILFFSHPGHISFAQYSHVANGYLLGSMAPELENNDSESDARMENKFWEAVLNEPICRTGAMMEMDQLTQALESDIPGFRFKVECVWPLTGYLCFLICYARHINVQ